MDYRYLKAFLLTAEHASFSKAALILNIAQSAVSRQIKLLEESLGEELIIRSSKKVLLTHKGEELYTITRHFDKMSHDLFEREDHRPLNIGILHGLLRNWFPPILSKYCKKTQRNIRLNVKDEPELLAGIEAGKLDIIFTTLNIQSELVTSLKLFSEKLVLISRDEIQKKKLNEYTWIVFSEGDNLFKVSPKISDRIISVESISAILTLVKNGLGIAVVPDHVLPKNHQFQISEVTTLPRSEIYMTTLNYKTMPNHIKEMSLLVTNP